MRRRQLVAVATAGAFTAVVAALAVTAAPLVRHTAASAKGPPVAKQAIGVIDRLRPRAARRPPLVIAHRGASAYRAEHTLEAYRLAAQLDADYIEADLVITADGELVARHESELSLTTDVALHPEFADRRRTKRVDGATTTGWFTEDFTLAELRTLRAATRGGARTTPQQPTSPPSPPSSSPPLEAAATVPNLQEIIDLVRAESATRRRPVGLYLELKSPGYFRAAGLPLEQRLAEILRRNGLDTPGAAVFVESFEAESLRTLHQLVDVPLIQLIRGGAPGGEDPLTRPEWLVDIRLYAAGIGVDRARLVPSAQSRLVQAAHGFGLEVHAFTFIGDASEYQRFYDLGVDGVFTDNPDVAVSALPR